jgi:signal transduction histidine kinase
MNAHVQVTLGRLTQPDKTPYQDGVALADQCIDALIDSERFPPALFILWITPAFAGGYRAVLEGIRTRLAQRGWSRVPLIGTSVAVCLFDEKAHERGAVLICLASRFLKAEVTHADGALEDPKQAAARSLDALNVGKAYPADSSDEQFLITFLSGFRPDGDPSHYRPAEAIAVLRTKTSGRLPIFGGISSAGLGLAGPGHQFANDVITTGGMAVALVSSRITYGMSVSHGLKPTGKEYNVEELSSDGRSILSFREGSASEVGEQIKQQNAVFTADGPGDTDVVVVACPAKDRLKLLRTIPFRARLKVMQPDARTMLQSVAHGRRAAQRRAGFDREAPCAALLGVCCVSRYRMSSDGRFDVQDALRKTKERFPNAAYAACYLDGEIGTDRVGRPDLHHWSVSELLFFDKLPKVARLSLAYEALSDAITDLPEPINGPLTVEQAMQRSLQRVVTAGYAGGMISILVEGEGAKLIVGEQARGLRWEVVVLPNTRREVGGRDVLAQALRNPEGWVYVEDAQNQSPISDVSLAQAAGIHSFVALVLQDDHGPIGVLQIDLDDRRGQGEPNGAEREFLKFLGRRAAAAINRAIRTEELDLVRHLDRTFERLQADPDVTLDQAASELVTEAARRLGLHGHVRLLSHDGNELRLAGGFGEYYDALVASQQRLVVSMLDGSPSTAVVRELKNAVYQGCGDQLAPAARGADEPLNCETDPTQERCVRLTLAERYKGTRLEVPLGNMAASADFVLCRRRGPALGMVSFYSDRKWYFTRHRLRSLEDVVWRLELLLTSIEERQQTRRNGDHLRFLSSIIARPVEESGTPAETSRRIDLAAACTAMLRKLKDAANAHVASCYLWDRIQERYVLRAECGWCEPGWVGAAWYRKGEGVTGTLAVTAGPKHFPDLRDYEREIDSRANVGKYRREMFGVQQPSIRGADQTWELLAFPLRARGESLGVITLFRRIRGSLPRGESGFATVDENVLRSATDLLSTYFADLLLHDETRWREAESTRLSRIDAVLMTDAALPDLYREICEKVVGLYRTSSCSIFEKEQNKDQLVEVARAGPPRQGQRAQVITPGEDPVWRAFTDGETKIIRWPATAEQKNPDLVRAEHHVRSVCLPLFEGRRCVGVLKLCWRGAPDFGKTGRLVYHDRDLLEDLAGRIAAACAASRLRAKHEEAGRRRDRTARALEVMGTCLATHAFFPQGLASMQSGINLLRRDANGEMAETLYHLERSVKSLQHNFDFLRQVGQQGENLARKRVALRDLVERAVNCFRTKIEYGEIDVSLNGLDFQVSVYPDLLVEAIKILVDNAVVALNDETVRSPQLIVSAYVEQGACCLRVADTGPGMPPEIAASLRKGEHRSSKPNGGGVGVLLAQQICNLHGGRLDFTSTPGQGTAFILSIPMKEGV